MRDVLHVDRFEQADALFKPQRVEVLRRLDEPRSCTEVGMLLDQSPQRVYYHVKKLVDAELVEQVDERRVRGIHEGIYRAAARSNLDWVGPSRSALRAGYSSSSPTLLRRRGIDHSLGTRERLDSAHHRTPHRRSAAERSSLTLMRRTRRTIHRTPFPGPGTLAVPKST